MLRFSSCWLLSCCLLFGCADTSDSSSSSAQTGESPRGDQALEPSAPEAENDEVRPVSTEADGTVPADQVLVDRLQPVPVRSGKAILTPENTRIEFVGVHAGDKPDPRTGGFEQFTGQAVVDPETQALQSVAVKIQTGSLWTTIPKLTAHLKSPDFFEVREYPEATFTSTSIQRDPQVADRYRITGDLTLHGQTDEVQFPALVQVTEQGVVLHSQFTLDRSRFGMNYGLDRVEKDVAMTVVIGAKTAPRQDR